MERYSPLHDITLVSELHRLDVDDRPFRRAVAAGSAVRIHHGAYMDANTWRALTRVEQYRHQVVAAAASSRTHPVLGHASAAIMWGIPQIGPLPKLVHVLASIASGTRTEGSFRRHATAFPEQHVEEVHGALVTSLPRTLLDLARSGPYAAAVIAWDWALTPSTLQYPKPVVTLADLAACADLLEITRGLARIDRVAKFANGLSGSAGESFSRVQVHELGFPPPILQQRFDDRRGCIGFTDFWWPEFQLMGEFDGLIKYTRTEYMKGMSIDQVVMAEKKREDRLRALGPSMTRWLWPDVWAPHLLFAQLVEAGLPSSRTASGRMIIRSHS